MLRLEIEEKCRSELGLSDETTGASGASGAFGANPRPARAAPRASSGAKWRGTQTKGGSSSQTRQDAPAVARATGPAITGSAPKAPDAPPPPSQSASANQSSIYKMPPSKELLEGFGLFPVREDIVFLAKRLPYSAKDCADVIAEYIHRWKTAMESEPVEYRRQNVGRRAANLWLLRRG